MRMTPILLAAALLPACASTKGESYTKAGFDPMSVERIAVVDGNNPTYKSETRQQLVDATQFEFLGHGWNVVERANLQKALDEVKFQNGDTTTPDQRKQLGKVLNVGALAFVNIGSVGNSLDDISITIKLVDVESGDLLWMGTGDGSVNKGLSTAAGALAGAAIGAVVGHQVSRSGSAPGVGAAIGGIAGGTTGAGLSPNAIENAKDLVKVICKNIPKRG